MVLSLSPTNIALLVILGVFLLLVIVLFLLSRVKGFRSENYVPPVVNKIKSSEAEKKAIHITTQLENIVNMAKSKGLHVDLQTDDEWLRRFYNYASRIIQSDLQAMWGDILVFALQNPGKLSLHTLEVLKSTNVSEMKLFSKIGQFIVNNEFIFSDVIVNEKYFSYSEIMTLQETDLIHDSSFVPISKKLEKDQKYELTNGNLIVSISNPNDTPYVLNFPIYELSKAGSEITAIIRTKGNDECFIRNIKDIKQKNRNLVIKVYNKDDKKEINVFQ